MYKTTERLITLLWIQSPQEMVFGGFAMSSRTTNLHVQATIFKPTDLTYHYFTLIRRSLEEHDRLKPATPYQTTHVLHLAHCLFLLLALLDSYTDKLTPSLEPM